jgi:hypothetical protein
MRSPIGRAISTLVDDGAAGGRGGADGKPSLEMGRTARLEHPKRGETASITTGQHY